MNPFNESTRLRRGVALVSLALLLAGLLLAAGARAQPPGAQLTTLPVYVNQNPGYWYELYQKENTRAEGLVKSGRTAISGLQRSLDSANRVITEQQERIELFSDEVGLQYARAEVAETALKPVTDERDRLRGRTWAGRLLRKGRNVSAGVGAVWIGVKVLKLVL